MHHPKERAVVDEHRQKVLDGLVTERHRRAAADRLRDEITGFVAKARAESPARRAVAAERRATTARRAETIEVMRRDDGLTDRELTAEREPSPEVQRLARSLDALHRSETAPPVEPVAVDEPLGFEVEHQIARDRRQFPTSFRGA
jgi:hypothetical protein